MDEGWYNESTYQVSPNQKMRSSWSNTESNSQLVSRHNKIVWASCSKNASPSTFSLGPLANFSRQILCSKTYLIKSDCLRDQGNGRSLQRRRSHSVNIKNHHKMMDRLKKKQERSYLRMLSVRSLAELRHSIWKVKGQSVMLYQQVPPLPNTHRFVRLLLMDASWGVQSVRPAHQGYHQEATTIEKDMRVRMQGIYVPANTWC